MHLRRHRQNPDELLERRMPSQFGRVADLQAAEPICEHRRGVPRNDARRNAFRSPIVTKHQPPHRVDRGALHPVDALGNEPQVHKRRTQRRTQFILRFHGGASSHDTTGRRYSYQYVTEKIVTA